MKKRLFLIHTINQFKEMIVDPFGKPFLEEHPEVEIFNICDDSLLVDTRQRGEMPNEVAARILDYIYCAERAGADAVMITCTSVNEAAQFARRFAKIPVFNIDEPMVKLALNDGSKIGVLGTLPTSPVAIVRLLKEEANNRGKRVEIITKVAEGAFDLLTAGNVSKHDELVEAALFQLAKEVDVVTFAQVSMGKVILKDCGKPVFKIGKSGFDEAARLLDLQKWLRA
jgi:aspartate/glutamate racemase